MEKAESKITKPLFLSEVIQIQTPMIRRVDNAILSTRHRSIERASRGRAQRALSRLCSRMRARKLTICVAKTRDEVTFFSAYSFVLDYIVLACPLARHLQYRRRLSDLNRVRINRVKLVRERLMARRVNVINRDRVDVQR